MAEMFFWPAKTRKNLNFGRCIQVLDLVLKCCSDINEGIWIQHLFHFLVLVNVVASFIGESFFICEPDFRLRFSPIAVIRKRLQLESKTDLTNGLILQFFWLDYAWFCRFHICMDWNLQELLYWFLTTLELFDSLRVILVCSLNATSFFSLETS